MPPLRGKWRRFGPHDFPNEHSHHCRFFRANRLIEQGPWDGIGTFLGHAAIAELSPVSGIRRKLDFEPAEGSFWRIVLKKSFFADD